MVNISLPGKVLELRALEPEDLELLYNWENDTEIWKVSDRIIPVSKYVLKQYLENSNKDIFEAKQLRLVIQTQKGFRPVGTIDLFDFDPFHGRAGIGILIAEKGDRRKGFAAEALELLISYSFNTLNLHLLYCTVTSDNIASIELFKQAGFVITGTRVDWIKDGERYLDEHFLQLVR